MLQGQSKMESGETGNIIIFIKLCITLIYLLALNGDNHFKI